MPGDELKEGHVSAMLQHLYDVSTNERLFCPYCKVTSSSGMLNLNLVVSQLDCASECRKSMMESYPATAPEVSTESCIPTQALSNI